jgi:branched-chain amino acid:cation transporter, LIVCS family
MKKIFNSQIIATGLAIFSMFFGAGNLMFPMNVGLISGDQTIWGMAGFLLTSVLLPLTGLVSIILFQGDYHEFFSRAGKIFGTFFLVLSIWVVGPLIAMPRIVTLSYTMISPFIPGISLLIFSIAFLAITFFATYKESKILDFLGYIISPLLLISLVIIILKGIMTGTDVTTTGQTALSMFCSNLQYGYQTLDVLGSIFFSAFVINILQKNYSVPGKPDFKKFAIVSFKAGILGVSLLGIVYIGLSYLGAYFGHGLEGINEGELFSAVSFRVLGSHGAAIIAVAVLMACYSTIIALTGIFAEYLTNDVFKKKISYPVGIILALALTLIPSIFGLGTVLSLSKPLILITYPAIIVLTLCNIAYKLFNFRWVKLPILLTLIASSIAYFI